ncbi:hypothetical protein [Geoalkalibacter sp.]|uniref:hypothetical protein n=1 Tax=Geoalkalibacter sp. TaxID=3041440 RepID=UPI00272E58B7|nr:hypothetical protein [Geoalkalibacter sp.]
MRMFFAAWIVFLAAFAGLGVGLFFRRPAMRRGCAATGEDCRCDVQKQLNDCDCQ